MESGLIDIVQHEASIFLWSPNGIVFQRPLTFELHVLVVFIVRNDRDLRRINKWFWFPWIEPLCKDRRQYDRGKECNGELIHVGIAFCFNRIGFNFLYTILLKININKFI